MSQVSTGAASGAEPQIIHQDKNVFLVTPPPGLLEQPGQELALQAFFKSVADAAGKHHAAHNEGAIIVLDMASTSSMNSRAIYEMAEVVMQLKENGHQLVLAKTDRYLARILNKIENRPIKFDMHPAAMVVTNMVENPPRPELREDDQTPPPASGAVSAPAAPPVAPPPPPSWKIEQEGNAYIITPAQDTRLNETSQGSAFVDKVKELLPDPAQLPHGAKPKLIVNMETVTSLTGDAVGALVKLPGLVKARGMDLAIVNIEPTMRKVLESMRLENILSLSDKPIPDLVQAANAKTGAAASY